MNRATGHRSPTPPPTRDIRQIIQREGFMKSSVRGVARGRRYGIALLLVLGAASGAGAAQSPQLSGSEMRVASSEPAFYYIIKGEMRAARLPSGGASRSIFVTRQSPAHFAKWHARPGCI
jgi:hypothetical protein